MVIQMSSLTKRNTHNVFQNFWSTPFSRNETGSERETRFEHSKIERYINLSFDIFECLNHGIFFTSSLVSGERYRRKILKKIPAVSLTEFYNQVMWPSIPCPIGIPKFRTLQLQKCQNCVFHTLNLVSGVVSNLRPGVPSLRPTHRKVMLTACGPAKLVNPLFNFQYFQLLVVTPPFWMVLFKRNSPPK